MPVKNDQLSLEGSLSLVTEYTIINNLYSTSIIPSGAYCTH